MQFFSLNGKYFLWRRVEQFHENNMCPTFMDITYQIKLHTHVEANGKRNISLAEERNICMDGKYNGL